VVGGRARILQASVRRMPIDSVARRVNLIGIDVLVATALTAGALVAVVSQNRLDLAPLAVVASVLATASVAWRRRSPLTATLVAISALIALTFLESDAADRQLIFEPVAMALDVYMLGRLVDGEKSHRILLGCSLYGIVGLLIGSLYPGGWSTASFVAGTAIFLALPLGVGHLITRRKSLIEALREATRSLEHEQQLIAAQSAEEERGRIARELHDAIAHSLSVMVIQASAARRKLTSDHVATHDALHVVIQSGREALEELRRIMGVVQRSDDGVGGVGGVAPGLSQIETLLERTRAAGVPVEFHIEGDPCTLAPGVDLAAYRLIQEALTNVIKHAGPATVVIRMYFRAERLELEVTDSGIGPASSKLESAEPGHGLIGMRERVALFGGELWTGPADDGGFVVRASVPVAAS
jgi:signal transduction histidine kinase